MSENGEHGLLSATIIALMNLDPSSCFKALQSRDARFDGRFFVGVRSTGVYCRPICTARTPLFRNCTFHESAASAEYAGFRPCLRCRPELAPGYASVDANERLARLAAARIEDSLLQNESLANLADTLGVTDRHLRRVFGDAFGMTPVAYAQTQRLLLAKRLLTDTKLLVTDVAMASGFGSLRRFNAMFQEQYGMPPSQLRARAGQESKVSQLTFRLAYRPPLDWAGVLRFLGDRAVPGVEHIEKERYYRSVAITANGKQHTGWLEVRAVRGKHWLSARLADSLVLVVPHVLTGVKRVFDLNADPHAVNTVLGPLAERNPGLRVPGALDGFELAVRAVLGQQVTVAAARTLATRLVQRFGGELKGAPHVTRLFPAPRTLVEATSSSIGELGIVRTRVHAIQQIARAMADGRLKLDPSAAVEDTMAELRAIKGIGLWTAEYIAMRALSWPDAFPPGDVALMKALGVDRAAEATTLAEQWRPWRSYAVLHLWRSLEKAS